MAPALWTDVRPFLKAGAVVVVAGTVVSILLPQHALPAPWGNVSDVMGITYTLAWSYSFYPQFFLNMRRRCAFRCMKFEPACWHLGFVWSVEGLSIEFQMLNLLGFMCYAAYNVALYCIPAVQHEYVSTFSQNIPVNLEDVAFAVHASLITAATLVQCVLFDRGGQRFFTPIGITAVAVGACSLGAFGAVAAAEAAARGGPPPVLSWLHLLLLLSGIKLVVSLVKYIPQVVLNVNRRSTVGWSIENVLLDLTGGPLSVAQLVMQCAVKQDWTQIAGNPVKFGLGFVSMLFDCVFIAQHYVLYADARSPDVERGSSDAGAGLMDGEGGLLDGAGAVEMEQGGVGADAGAEAIRGGDDRVLDEG